MSIQIQSVTQANVYLDGANLLGRCAEFKPPEVTWKMVEHKALGMVGDIEIPAGGIEKMEATFKWQSYYPDVLRRTGDPRAARRVQVRSVIERYTGRGLVAQVPLVIDLGGIFHKSAFGEFKPKEGAAPEHTMAVYYFKVTADGEQLLEVDVMANIYVHATEDILATYRNLIGG